jgi:hypothetical protein
MNTLPICFAVAVTAPALAGNLDNVENLRSLVTELQGEVAQLRAESNGSWISNQRAADYRSLVQDVLADADTRSSLDGHDGGINISGQLQVRFTDNGDYTDGTGDTKANFSNRRTRLSFKGDSAGWGYKVGVNLSDGGNYDLRDAYITMDLGNGMTAKTGQFKSGLLRSERVGSKWTLAADQSVTNATFNQGFSQGLEVSNAGDQIAWAAGYTTGTDQDNTDDVTAGPANTDADGFYVRGAYLVSGSWGQFKKMYSMPGSDEGLMVEGSYAELETEDGDLENELITMAAAYHNDGWHASVQYVDVESDAAGTVTESDALTFEAGFFLNDEWQAFARMDEGELGTAEYGTTTVGANYFVGGGDTAKITIDYSWTTEDNIDDVANIGLGGTGFGASDEDDQSVWRVQAQLLF